MRRMFFVKNKQNKQLGNILWLHVFMSRDMFGFVHFIFYVTLSCKLTVNYLLTHSLNKNPNNVPNNERC